MHFVWPMTTLVLFIAFFDNGNVEGNNLEIQVTQKLKEMTVLKEHLESLQKDIEKHISSFLNNNGLMKLKSMVQALAQEKVIRINFGKKIESMLEAYGQQLADLATTVENIDINIENRLLANTNATELSFRSKIKETVSTMEEKCTGSMSELNQTLGNLYEQFNQWRVPKQGLFTFLDKRGGLLAGSLTDGSILETIKDSSKVISVESIGSGVNDVYAGGRPEELMLRRAKCPPTPASPPVNGGWTAWGSWTRCSSSCGSGVKNRVRTCTNPTPAKGGNDCVGDALECVECRDRSCQAMAFCDYGWKGYSGSCYLFIDMIQSRRSWTDAQAFCEGASSNLLRIDNQMEFEFIQRVLRDNRPLPGYWIGAYYNGYEWQWTWSPNPEKMRFTVWSSGEPNNEGGVEYCGELNHYKQFLMNDYPCWEKQYFICEKLLVT